jgi:lipopolysaccharide transport system permease protein
MDTLTRPKPSLKRPVKRRARVIRRDSGSNWSQGSQAGPLAPFLIAWRQRQLLWRLVQRDIEQHFRGSALGKIWAALAPLFMLTLYTVSFGLIIRPQWQSSISSPGEVALIYFSGLIVFNFFFDCINRAPTLMFDNTTYIKKVIFPVEILAWVVLGGALFRLFVSMIILSAFYFLVKGMPPVSAVIIPLLFVLLSMVAIGFVWLLSSLSVFLRDIRHIIVVLMPAFMFLTPVFFPLSAAPKAAQHLLYANPLTFILEGMRGALFKGQWPNGFGLAGYAVLAWLFSWLAYRVFIKLRTGFADVL